MTISRRLLIFLALILSATLSINAQEPQDKKASLEYMAGAKEIMAATRAIDIARDQMVQAANIDTTNIEANFEAGYMHIESIGRDLAVKYFLRVYRQSPNYRFDLEYWIGKAYQYGLKFDNAIEFYTKYRSRYKSKPGYAGKDRVDISIADRGIAECKNGKEFVANPKPFSITNMGSAINSEFEDNGPVVDANDDLLVFTTRRQDDNMSPDVADDAKYYEDIFFSEKKSEKWGRAQNIGAPVNTTYFDAVLALSADGKLLFLYKDEGLGDIYVSEKGDDGKWGTPVPLPGGVNSSYRESSVSISTDEKTLYFASDRPGGYGGSDIYVCTKDSKGEWSRVKNLGPNINTDLDEDGPFISFDSKTLYFSSEGHKSMGGFDIFRAELLNPEKNEWSEPENIGYPINSPDDDIFYTTAKGGLKSYYASVREGGYGYTDIYEITDLEKEKEQQPQVVKNEPVKEEPKKEEPVKEEPKKEEPRKEIPVKETPKKEIPAKKPIIPVKYLLTVVDAETKQPLDAKVRMQGLKDKVVVGMIERGEGVTELSIVSPTAKDYLTTVEKEGYIFETVKEKIAGATTSEKTITKTIQLRKLKVNAVSILRNIYFDFNKATFKTESNSELNRLETMMKQNPGLQVEISGHTDYVGTKEFNKSLSLRRANAVRSFLTTRGIDPRRIKTIGYGKERPIASNDDELEGRELNRRVEFKVLGN